MDKNELIRRVLNPVAVEYSYAIGFFVVFIFSVILVVRPSVSTVFTESQQLADLRSLNEQYGKTIDVINSLQNLLLVRQNDFPLLDEALPDRLRVYQIITDMQRLPLASDSAKYLDLAGFQVGTAKKITKVAAAKSPGYQTYLVTLRFNGDYEKLQDILNTIMSQRRVKTIKNLTITRVKDTNQRDMINVQIALDIYNL